VGILGEDKGGGPPNGEGVDFSKDGQTADFFPSKLRSWGPPSIPWEHEKGQFPGKTRGDQGPPWGKNKNKLNR